MTAGERGSCAGEVKGRMTFRSVMGRWVGKNKAELIVYPKKQDTFESEGATVNNHQDDLSDWALSLIMMLSPSKGHERSTRPTGTTDGGSDLCIH